MYLTPSLFKYQHRFLWVVSHLYSSKDNISSIIRFKSTDCWMESQDLHCKSSTSRCQYDPEQSAKCSTVRNGTMQCFGTAAQEGTASAFADAAPSCFFAHSLFIFCVTSSTMRWRSSSLCALPYSISASSRIVSIFRDHTSNTPLLIVPFRVRAKYFL